VVSVLADLEPTDEPGDVEQVHNAQDKNPDSSHREQEESSSAPTTTEHGLIELLEKTLAFHTCCKHGHPFEWDAWEKDSSIPWGALEEDAAGQSAMGGGVCESCVHVQIQELVSMVVS